MLPRRRCGCGKITTAAPPFGAVGDVVYRRTSMPAAILLASKGNVPIERTAMLIEAMLGIGTPAGGICPGEGIRFFGFIRLVVVVSLIVMGDVVCSILG